MIWHRLCCSDGCGYAARAAQIFMLDVKEQDRSRADGQVWKEDAQWARILDEGWDLGRVKQARPRLSSSWQTQSGSKACMPDTVAGEAVQVHSLH